MALQCSICHDEITVATGKTVLSCAHSFHLKCIGTWLLKNSSCPCCRAGPSEYELLTQLNELDDAIPDDILEEGYRFFDEANLMNPIVPELRLPAWFVGGQFISERIILEAPIPEILLPALASYNGLDWSGALREYERQIQAAKKIQAIVRGWLARLAFSPLLQRYREISPVPRPPCSQQPMAM